LVGVILIAIYVLLPWIPINGHPAVFLDMENRMFHVFGLTLVPQDLWVMFFAISGLGFGLFSSPRCSAGSGAAGPAPTPSSLITSIAGSSAGSRATRRRAGALDAAPWGRGKIIRRAQAPALSVHRGGDRARLPVLLRLAETALRVHA
jgi:polyferredoxin